MAAKKKIYPIIFTNSLGATLTQVHQAQIGYYNREYKINSICWDFRARLENLPLNNIPLEQNSILEIGLEFISLPVGIPIGEGYTNPTPLINVTGNAVTLALFRPGKRNFDNFYLSNEMDLVFYITNRDQINAIRFYSSIIIEIEDI